MLEASRFRSSIAEIALPPGPWRAEGAGSAPTASINAGGDQLQTPSQELVPQASRVAAPPHAAEIQFDFSGEAFRSPANLRIYRRNAKGSGLWSRLSAAANQRNRHRILRVVAGMPSVAADVLF